MSSLGCEIDEPVPMERLQHTFTHFRLRILPVLCEVRRSAPIVEQPGRMWIAFSDASGAALPAPVKKLLERLAAQQRVQVH
jgi:A/G-specific adenine glycosylase